MVPGAVSKPSHAAAGATPSASVLVIDDTASVRQLAVTVLRKQGFRVLQAADGQEGLEVALRERPDLALCDINMPVLDGWGFVSAARTHEELLTLPILMLTTNSDRESVRRAMATGADDYLTKPWKPAELIDAVNALLVKVTRHREDTERSLNRLRGAILATVPHELRTPLTSILGMTQLMIHRRGRYTEDRMFEMVQTVHGSATRLARTITRMMDWAELTSVGPDARVEPGRLNCRELVPRLLKEASFRSEIEAALPEHLLTDDPLTIAGHALRPRLEPGIVLCELRDFRRILTELVANAVRFSRPDMPVGVTGGPTPEGDYALEIANVGVAIPQTFLRQIGALAQADRHQQEQQGIGLGLALTRMLAQRNDVHFELPRYDGHPTIARVRFKMAPDLEAA
jgi:two-component system, sensor histidine kinase and response regulator